MSRITGTISIDFETDKDITEEQFYEFEKHVKSSVHSFEFCIEEAAHVSGFESNEIHLVLLDELDFIK